MGTQSFSVDALQPNRHIEPQPNLLCRVPHLAMKDEARRALFSFAIEMIVYGFFIAGYFLLVLHLLGPSLARIEQEHIRWYALLCVALILGQSIVLESLTTFILRILRGRSE